MRKTPAGIEDVVASALVEAVVAARWEGAEILSRRPADATAELLRGHSAELGNSPFARDQLLKLALEAAAADIEIGRSPLEQGALFYLSGGGPDPKEREKLRTIVAGLAAMPPDACERLTPEFERRQSSHGLTEEELCLRLNQEAQLQEALSDDPRLSAEPVVRLMMLRSVAGFRERAASLNPSRVQARGKAERRRVSDATGQRRRVGFVEFAASLLRSLGFPALAIPSSQRVQDRSR